MLCLQPFSYAIFIVVVMLRITPLVVPLTCCAFCRASAFIIDVDNIPLNSHWTTQDQLCMVVIDLSIANIGCCGNCSRRCHPANRFHLIFMYSRPLRGDTKLLRVPKGLSQLSQVPPIAFTIGPITRLGSLSSLLEPAVELLWLTPRRGNFLARPLFSHLHCVVVPSSSGCNGC